MPEHTPPLVSIISPTYNHAGFIGACIASVQAQTYPHWEMLIVNDGSTDGTAAVVRGFIDQDPRIRLIDRENVGLDRLQETYNVALEQAQGKYIAVLEGDDLWEPEKLHLQVEAFEANPAAVVCWSGAAFVGDDQKPIGYSVVLDAPRDEAVYNNTPVGNFLNHLYLHNCMAAVTVAVRATALRKIGGFRQSHNLPLVDLPTWLPLAELGPFVFIPQNLARWRWHPTQVTKSMHTQIIHGIHGLVSDHYRALPPAVRANVKVTQADVEQAFAYKIHEAYAQSGRYKLVQRRFKDARADFKNALFYPGSRGLSLRLQSVLGYTCSLFGQDMEAIARLMGKSPLS